MQIELSTSPSHSILTPGRPVPALTLRCQAPGRVATGVPSFKSLVCLDPKKSRRKRDSNPGSSALEADYLTTRPTRRPLENVGFNHSICRACHQAVGKVQPLEPGEVGFLTGSVLRPLRMYGNLKVNLRRTATFANATAILI